MRRVVIIVTRITLCFAVPGVSPNSYAHDVAQNDSVHAITSVDVYKLVRDVFPDAKLMSSPILRDRVVVYEFRGANNGRIDILLGIYETEQLAIQAMFPGPSAGTMIPLGADGRPEIGPDEGYFTVRGCYLRVANVFLAIQTDRDFNQEIQRARFRYWRDLLLSHSPTIMTKGIPPNVPQIQVVDLSYVIKDGQRIENAFNVVSRIDDEGGLLFPDTRYPRAHQVGEGLYEFVLLPDSEGLRRRFMCARPTGEIAIFELSEELRHGVTEAMPRWEERQKIEKARIPNEEREELIRQIRAAEGTNQRQGEALRRLAQEGASASIPLFLDILESDRDILKYTALIGLHKAKNADAKPDLLRIAADGHQPAEIRRRALVLVQQIGWNVDEDERYIRTLWNQVRQLPEDFVETAKGWPDANSRLKRDVERLVEMVEARLAEKE